MKCIVTEKGNGFQIPSLPILVRGDERHDILDPLAKVLIDAEILSGGTVVVEEEPAEEVSKKPKPSKKVKR